ncbi:glycosyltransferase [Fundidesulfovibrio terrae]|uniref:glycosyltransferase n=1 Tax=Fundidesulfovibrio terrae TaxID=2922866 RepID=UPI001FB0118C|nr:glycosyltransferase [Fundidesulfovibrio terrae]
MARQLKIVIGGYAVGFPLGGQMWVILHYALGLTRLGHEVVFVEDSSDWALPFDPVKGFASADSSFGRNVLGEAFDRVGLPGRWAYTSLFEGRSYGMDQEDLKRFCSKADLFLNVSGIIPLHEHFMKARVRAVIDTDPVFTQAKISKDEWTRDYFNRHDVRFTFGHNIPTGSTGVPLSGIEYIPTRPPVILDQWPVVDGAGAGFTTIGNWDAQGRDIVHDGKKLSWRKSEKYEKIIDLPGKLPGVTLDLTMSGMKEDAGRFAAHGWNVKDALALSRDIWAYRDYILNSTGEFTVAKEQNIQLKSGWFSDRSASYLAAGRPVIVEDTGFGTYLPVGEGLVTFDGVDNAKAAIETVLADYPKHRAAARKIAEEYFDSNKVLTDLLKTAGLA